MRRILTAGFVWILLLVQVNGQEGTPVQIDTAAIMGQVEAPSFSPWRYNTTVGSSFMVAPGYGSAFSTFVAPSGSFRATERFSLHGGMVFSHTNFLSSYTSEGGMAGGNGVNSLGIYMAGAYRLTDQLVLHGSGYKQLNAFPVLPGQPNYDFSDISVGATYNFGNFSIGASFHRGNSRNMYQPGFMSPFGF